MPLVIKPASGSGSATLISVAGTTTNDTLTLPAKTGNIITSADSGTVTTAMLATGAITSGILPAGTVVQVVQSSINSTQSTTSTSYVASNLTASITPKSSSNKILILLTGGNSWNNTNSGECIVAFYKSVSGGAYSAVYDPAGIRVNPSNATAIKLGWSISYLDSPATTSALTYQPYFKVSGGGGTSYFKEGTIYVQLTLFEVAA
jgi:hypothetical protein